MRARHVERGKAPLHPGLLFQAMGRADGRICEFSKPYDRAKARRVFPDATAYVHGLNRIPGPLARPAAGDSSGGRRWRAGVGSGLPEVPDGEALSAVLYPLSTIAAKEFGHGQTGLRSIANFGGRA